MVTLQEGSISKLITLSGEKLEEFKLVDKVNQFKIGNKLSRKLIKRLK